jgi:hypothetical protein
MTTTLRVKVSDQNGERLKTVELPNDKTVETLLNVLPQRLGYQVQRQNGDPIDYKLYRGNDEIPPGSTLEQAGVRSGDSLWLNADASAGSL